MVLASEVQHVLSGLAGVALAVLGLPLGIAAWALVSVQTRGATAVAMTCSASGFLLSLFWLPSVPGLASLLLFLWLFIRAFIAWNKAGRPDDEP